MKTRFEDLTRDQILSLTDEDIKYYTQYRLAQEGIVLPPYPGEKPEEIHFPDPTEVVYECRGILLTDIKEAQTLATLESVVYEDCDYNVDSSKKYITNEQRYGSTNTGVKKRMLYKRSVIEAQKSDLKRNKAEIDAWDSDNSDYNKAVKESESITSFISDICYQVATEDNFINRAISQYENLLTLAENNKQIAYNFFVKAFPVESTSDKLADFYSENDIDGISVLSYEEFAKRCGVEIPAIAEDNQVN